MKKRCEARYCLHFSNGAKEIEEREIVCIHLDSHEISEAKTIEIKEKLEKFLENELPVILGW